MPVATIDIGLASNKLERDILAQLQNIERRGLRLNISRDNGLGQITGQVSQFERSLAAAEARVLSFTAAAGSLYLVGNAMRELFRATVDVEKSLADINTVFGRSSAGLQQFGNQLFNVARETSQSFATTAKAALEFSRQGLGVEETIKRTRDALILYRTTGLDIVSATEFMTAALNSFKDEVSDSTELINKLAAVDTAFAVSSADIAEGIKRFGAVAKDLNISLDESIGLITSLQATTSRGGAVIGNSLKSIGERIIRPETLKLLDDYRIATENSNGELLNGEQILKNLAKAQSELTASEKNNLVNKVASVYQANALRSLLRDLSKETNIYSQATERSANATNEATERNKQLNVTLDALLSRTGTTLKQLGSQIGEKSIGPFLKDVLGRFEGVFNESGSSDVGEQFGISIGKSIVSGLGSFIAGPGLVAAGAILIRLTTALGKNAFGAVRTLLQFGSEINNNNSVLNTTIGKFEAIRAKIQASNDLLIRMNVLLQQVNSGGTGVGPLGGGTAGGGGRRGGIGGLGVVGALATGLGQTGYSPDYFSNLSAPIPTQSVPDASRLTSKGLSSSISQAFPILGGLNSTQKKDVTGITREVNKLLIERAKLIERDPYSYLSPGLKSSSLKSIEKDIRAIVSSYGISSFGVGDTVVKEALAAHSNNLERATILAGNQSASSFNIATVSDRDAARRKDLSTQLQQSQTAGILADRERQAQRQAQRRARLGSFATGAGILAPFALAPASDALRNRGQTANASLLDNLGLGISVGSLLAAVGKLNPYTAVATGLGTLGKGAYDYIKNNENEPIIKLRNAIGVTSDKLSEITQLIDLIKNLEEEIAGTEDEIKRTKLFEKLNELIARGGGGVSSLEGRGAILREQNASNKINLFLAEGGGGQFPLESLGKIGAGGGTLQDFLSGDVGSRIRSLVSQGGEGNVAQAIGLLSDFDSEFASGLTRAPLGSKVGFLSGGVNAAKRIALSQQNARNSADIVGQTRSQRNRAINDLISSGRFNEISAIELGNRSANLSSEEIRRLDLEENFVSKRRDIFNADPFLGAQDSKIFGEQRVRNQTEAAIVAARLNARSGAFTFGEGALDKLKSQTTGDSQRSIDTIKDIRNLLGSLNIDDESKTREEIGAIKDLISGNNELKSLESEILKIEEQSAKFRGEKRSILEQETEALKTLNQETERSIELLKLTETRGGVLGRISSGNLSTQQGTSELNRIFERQLLGGDLSGGQAFSQIGRDFAGSFGYQSQDFFLEIRNGAISTANTIKSEFSQAFKDFARGTKDAKDAFRDFALNIAFSVQDKLIDVGINSLLGSTIGNIFKAGGGKIKRFSDGGLVTGGSGVYDDVPAKLAPGDFVLQKSSVAKYGLDNLSSLNNIDLKLANSFSYDTNSSNISPYLSSFALDDENNPQNALRTGRIENMRAYLGERSAYELQKSNAMKAFRKQKRQQLIGTYISAGLAGFSGITRGGVKSGAPAGGTVTGNFGYGSNVGLGFNLGGAVFGNDSAGDTVPAFLTAGEFVVKRSAASKIGYNNLEMINQGRAPRFAYGGSAGDYSDSISDSMARLVALTEQLNQSFIGFSRKTGPQSTDSNQTQAPVSVVVNINSNFDGAGNVKTESNASKSSESSGPNQETIKRFEDGMRAVVLDEILKQARPGGILASR